MLSSWSAISGAGADIRCVAWGGGVCCSPNDRNRFPSSLSVVLRDRSCKDGILSASLRKSLYIERPLQSSGLLCHFSI